MRLKIAVATLPLLVAACGDGGQQQMPPPDVNVAAVVKKSVTEWDEYSGHVEAIEWAEIRPRVAGHLYAVNARFGTAPDPATARYDIVRVHHRDD